MVSAVEYDAFGREQFKYLPFAAGDAGSNASIRDGLFKYNPFEQQAAFYDDGINGASPLAGQGESYFYGKTVFEPSPLNRPVETFAPGNSWMGSEGSASPRSVKMKHWLNTTTDAVRIWTVVNGASLDDFDAYSSDATYDPGQLYKTVTEDERGKQVIEFKDKEGKVVLKKAQLDDSAYDDGTTGKGHSGWLCTYYIYDGLDRLRCVLQPKGTEIIAGTWDLSDANLLAEQCFRYAYDERGRLIVKQVPGAKPVYMVYDKRDRLVMRQDGNLGTGIPKKWLVTLYDDLNRPVGTGLWTEASSRTAHAATTKNSPDYFYPFTQANVPSSGWEELTAAFYDNYNWVGVYGNPVGSVYNTAYDGYFQAASSSTWPYPQANAPSYLVKGMPTGSRSKVLGTGNTFMYTATFYDDKGRVIQSQTKNREGGLEISTTQYTWVGQPLLTVQRHQKTAGGDIITTFTQYGYDELGRLVKTEKAIAHPQVNGGAMPTEFTVVSENTYDALGQVKTKNLGRQKDVNGDYTTTPVETLAYDYNVRGWLLGMNKEFLSGGTASANNYFGLELSYDKDGIVTNASKQYNGNIGESAWRSRGDNEQRKYDYSYDNVNRLLKADFTQLTGTNAANVNFDVIMGDDQIPNSAYDANGNIKRMQQWGLILNSSPQIDDLRYGYQNSSVSNKLSGVTDLLNQPTSSLGDFKTLASHPGASSKAALNAGSLPAQFDAVVDYVYDESGNLTKDDNKAISAIVYNHLNLPSLITVAGKGTIVYTYDATGSKLQKITTESIATVNGQSTSITTTTDYVSGFVYESKVYGNAALQSLGYAAMLQFTGQEEGRIRAQYNDGGNPNLLTGFAYDYMVKDHLGNVRAVLTEEQKQDIYPAATLEGDLNTSTDAAYVEKRYYNIDPARVVNQSEAAGISTYQNNNGNPPVNNNPNGNPTANSAKLYKLTASGSAGVTGLGLTLKVMAGDRLDIFGKSYYYQANSTETNQPIPVLDILSGLFGAPASLAGSHGATASTVNGVSSITTDIGTFLSNGDRNSGTVPKAAINYLFMDEQFRYVSGGFSNVGSAGTLKDHAGELSGIPVTKNGYLYIYVSNESPVPVFFDNLQIIHTRSPLLEETHYYPFGLQMAGISSKAAGGVENKKKYNSHEQQSGEFSDGLGVEWLDYGARMYDAQIGRFMQPDPLAEKYFGVSPYAYCLNNPISLFDLDGRDAIITIDFEKKTITISSTIYLSGGTAERRKDYIDGANKYFKDNPNLFTGCYTDKDGGDWTMNISLDYQDIGDKNINKLGDGENVLKLNDLENTKNPSSGRSGAYQNKKTGEFEYLTTITADLRADSKENPGLVAVHETLHLLGLKDTYLKDRSGKSIGKNWKGFDRDIMSLGGGGKNNEMHQYHWNNWGNYLLNQPKEQPQQTQPKTQFVLRYWVELYSK